MLYRLILLILAVLQPDRAPVSDPITGALMATGDITSVVIDSTDHLNGWTALVTLEGLGSEAANVQQSDFDFGDIRTSGVLERNGTLAIEASDTGSLSVGDEFLFVSAGGGLTGSFDGFSGFDLAGNLAFKLEQRDENLFLVVTTDADAAAFL